MTKTEMAKLLLHIQQLENDLREAGQAEYAHDNENAFANFERVARHLGISPAQCLLVYLFKHMDGITAYVKGHRSQRESVKGRILDARVYLGLLYGMVEEEEGKAGMDRSNPTHRFPVNG